MAARMVLPVIVVRESDPRLRTRLDKTTYDGKPFSGIAFETWGHHSLHKLMFFWNGHKENTERHWYEDGTIWIEREYSRGKPHGEWRQWYPSGKVKALTLYNHGETVGEMWAWHESGAVASYARVSGERESAHKAILFDGVVFNNYVIRDEERVGVVGGDFCKVKKSSASL